MGKGSGNIGLLNFFQLPLYGSSQLLHIQSVADEKRIIASATLAAHHLAYECLKLIQIQVILAIVAGKDVFGILPMGFGKSLCYTSYHGSTSQL